MAARRTARVLRDTADALESLSTAVKTHATVPREWEEDLAAAIDAGPSDESGVMSSRHTVAGREIRRLQRSLPPHRPSRREGQRGRGRRRRSCRDGFGCAAPFAE